MKDVCTTKRAINYWNKGGFALCIGGDAEVVINEQNFRLTRGYAFIVTPLVQISEFRPSADYREISFIDDLRLFYPVFRLIADTSIPLNVRHHPCWQLSEQSVARVIARESQRREYIRLSATVTSPEERRLLEEQIDLVRRETMLDVVRDHLRRHPTECRPAERRESVAYRFLLSLHEHFRTERRIAWYAAEARLSTGHFSTIIRQATGKSPSQWTANITTTYAKLMLKQTGKSVKEIAGELNFPEQYTFRKYFKQHTGMSPTACRCAGEAFNCGLDKK